MLYAVLLFAFGLKVELQGDSRIVIAEDRGDNLNTRDWDFGFFGLNADEVDKVESVFAELKEKNAIADWVCRLEKAEEEHKAYITVTVEWLHKLTLQAILAEVREAVKEKGVEVVFVDAASDEYRQLVCFVSRAIAGETNFIGRFVTAGAMGIPIRPVDSPNRQTS